MPTSLIQPRPWSITGFAGVSATTTPGELSSLVAYSLAYKRVGTSAARELPRPEDAYRLLYGLAKGVVVLSTCARYEVYLETREPGARLEEALRAVYGRYYGETVRLLGLDAVRHLFRVASGLESPIIGEPEILGQVKSAWLKAREGLYTSRLLDAVFHRAIVAGKRARSETGISRGVLGYPQAAVHLASQLLGGLEGRKVAVVGAGQASSAIVSLICSKWRPARLTVYNRTLERAVRVASMCPSGEAKPLASLGSLRGYDAAFIAISGFSGVLEGASDAGLVVDISTPPVTVKRDSRVYHLEDVKRVSLANRSLRESEASSVESLVEEEIRRLVEQLKAGSADTVIAAIFKYAELAASGERQLTLKALDKGADAGEVLEVAFNSFSRKILRPLVMALRDLAKRGNEEALESIRRAYERELGGE
jgi:glutamyl-tRNA reductase